jgi:hypothetical protein
MNRRPKKIKNPIVNFKIIFLFFLKEKINNARNKQIAINLTSHASPKMHPASQNLFLKYRNKASKSKKTTRGSVAILMGAINQIGGKNEKIIVGILLPVSFQKIIIEPINDKRLMSSPEATTGIKNSLLIKSISSGYKGKSLELILCGLFNELF